MMPTPTFVERNCEHCRKRVRAWFMPGDEPTVPYLEVECPNPGCLKPVAFDPPGQFMSIEIVPD